MREREIELTSIIRPRSSTGRQAMNEATESLSANKAALSERTARAVANSPSIAPASASRTHSIDRRHSLSTPRASKPGADTRLSQTVTA